jgi:glycosyltransferase involved in cell wall biosynthesis
MKTSLIITVKNEENTIEECLDSLLSQSRMPDEIIIVDGGSTDKTVETIERYIKNEVPIKLIVAKGANIAQGRNIAIENAKHEIIASTDAGCITDKYWLKNLVAKFDDAIDVVSGVYKPLTNTTFEGCVGEITCPKVEYLNESTFMPSSRSVAFRKVAWEEVGGYPEKLSYAEDTVFNLMLKKAGFKFKLAKDAVVYWRMRSNLRELFMQYYNYAKWDAIAGVDERRTYYLTSIINITGLLMLSVVFLFVSRLAATLMAPFMLKNIFGLYRRDNLKKKIHKNMIRLTIEAANCLGYIRGKLHAVIFHG